MTRRRRLVGIGVYVVGAVIATHIAWLAADLVYRFHLGQYDPKTNAGLAAGGAGGLVFTAVHAYVSLTLWAERDDLE